MARVRERDVTSLPVVKQPALFLPELQSRTNDKRRLVLALDLGTKTGFSATLVDASGALDTKKLSIYQGQLDLRLNDYETRAVHALRLRNFLQAVAPDLVVVEDVKYTAQKEFGSVAAACARVYGTAEFFGGLKQAVADWGECAGVPVIFVPIGRIKQRATGRGRANKLDIIRAHNKEFGTTFDEATAESQGLDNVADSGFILMVGLEENWYGLQAAQAAGIADNNKDM